MGHPVGDELLENAARRIESCIRKDDILARIGGDEFAITLTHIENHYDAGRVAKKIIEALKPNAKTLAYATINAVHFTKDNHYVITHVVVPKQNGGPGK